MINIFCVKVHLCIFVWCLAVVRKAHTGWTAERDVTVPRLMAVIQ